ncbi:hypothetical protein [Streptomyces sp. NPDC085937]|uniref:hypothetical protein n=1 Tax=Streptomyces sp. NPDC085937 TaxID=3365742 RepID=UPI0037D215B7
MQRTTTTATLLVTVAVAALSGCVTVQRPLAPGPASAPPPGAGHDTAGREESPVVQAPAREALEMVDPPASPGASPSAGTTSAARPPRPDTSSDARNGQERSRQTRSPQRSEPDRRTPTRRPPARLPDVGGSLESGNSDVCALGREYGGWPADSPQARICQDTYGH